MNVNWTEAALSDLGAIEAYIARHSSRYAAGLIDRIFIHTRMLADHPFLGPVVPEYEDETLRELFEDPYRIVYRVFDERVDVVAVVHAARRMPRSL
jgi:toxin ParE1/3/4